MFDDSIVVVPWDFSEQSKCALDLAIEKTSPRNIHVFCALERPEPYTLQWGEEKEARALTKCEEQFWESVHYEKGAGIQFTAEFGMAAEEIVRFAKSLKAGLILMSTHGRNALERLVMGSVAKRVTQTASCPVLLLPNSWCQAHHGDVD
jgi:nucleotide-binding universal stress UspA family protein